MGLDVFHTLAEVAVAITGFSSLIIVFRGNSPDWTRQDYVGFSFVLTWSVGSIFLSLLPIVLAEFQITLDAATQIGLFSAIVYLYAAAGFLTVTQARVAKRMGETVPTKPRLIMGISFLIITSVAFAAGFGWLPGPRHAWYAATIVLLMMHATADLGVFVVQTTRRQRPEGA